MRNRAYLVRIMVMGRWYEVLCTKGRVEEQIELARALIENSRPMAEWKNLGLSGGAVLWLLKYGDGLKTGEIADAFGVSASRVQQILKRIDWKIHRAADRFQRKWPEMSPP